MFVNSNNKSLIIHNSNNNSEKLIHPDIWKRMKEKEERMELLKKRKKINLIEIFFWKFFK